MSLVSAMVILAGVDPPLDSTALPVKGKLATGG